MFAHTGEELPDPEEPASYYHELLVKRHIELELKKSLKAAAANLTGREQGPGSGSRRRGGVVMQLIARKFQRSVHDFARPMT